MEPYSKGLFFSFSGDLLSLFFAGLILLVSVPSMVYSAGYLKGHCSTRKLSANWIFTAIFIISMLLVVTVRNVFSFLVAWEIMSLVSFFMVVFDTEDKKSVSAGVLYIVMTHIGTALIITAFILMFKYTGYSSLDYSALKEGCANMPAGVKNSVFLLLFFGFGAKAGIVPLHVWLPSAHPQAPSHISAIMSGVMIKTAIYGMLRFIVMMLGAGELWWGMLVTFIAAVTCLTGIIYALTENDLKRLLAYSSIENIGIILLGVGPAMVLNYLGFPAQSVLMLAAAVFHLFNHALFKGLLFLTAGSVYNAAHTRNIEKLGGLAKLMPWTSGLFLVGALAVSAIPPLNGFMSEWLLLRSFFEAASVSGFGGAVFFTLTAGVLAFTGGLAAAAFVKAFGLTFLAAPRSRDAEHAKEVPFSMILPAVFLALCVVLSGVFAAPIFKGITSISGAVLGSDSAAVIDGLFKVNANLVGKPSFLPAVLLALLLAAVIGAFFGVRMLFGKNRIDKRRTWDCGYYALSFRNEYTATGFTKPFRVIFSFLLKPGRKVQKQRYTRYRVRSFKYDLSTTIVFNRYLYDPFVKLTVRSAKLVRKLQPGSIHLYLGYVLASLVVLIVIMRVL